ncbi:hypothetical protein [Microbacterium sp. Leaf179]|uniref:hypothetical protein n=1 Tax=Microbacterium sp. Leaf179 TaxID=1736288 RepID=UPI0012E3DABE|nr:hypothetical protein [Microbacterium sp. Leaf179]
MVRLNASPALLRLSYVIAYVASLIAGLWWFVSGSAFTIVTYIYGEDPRASLVDGQLKLAVVCLSTVLVHYFFSRPSVARQLNPRVARIFSRVSIGAAAPFALVAGALGLFGGVGLDPGTPFPWWQWFWTALAWVLPLFAVAVGSISVSAAVAGRPSSATAWQISFLALVPLVMILSALR